MVEAPGVAPGSENTCTQEYYGAYPPLSVAPGVKERQNRRAPVPENLAATVQDDRLPPAY